jgi:transposase
MSLHAPLSDVMPEQTIQVARAAFPKGNPSMPRRDERGPLDTHATCAARFSHTGRPAEAPAQLALITVMQWAAGLSDAQAAEAVRARIDWKYAVALDLTAPGFDAAVLRECRQRLLTGHAALLLFEPMWTRFQEQGLLKAQGRQRPDSTPGLAAIQTLNRLACIGETRRHALTVLATVAPNWLRSWVPGVWCDRSRQRFAASRVPPEKPARYTLAEHIGTDGRQLLGALYDPATPTWRRAVPAIPTLRHVWRQQFYATAAEPPGRWRTAADLPPAPLLIRSPYDPEARSGKKRETEWTGDKVHVPDTCDDETPNLSPDVTTTPATTAAFAVLPTMQMHLATRQMTPGEQLVEAGDVTSDHLLTSRGDHGRDLMGPTASDQSWPGQTAHGVAAAQLVIDGDATRATCPPGQPSVVGMERPDRHGHATGRMAFSKPGCGACASRADGTRAAPAPRALRLRERDHYTALQPARARQQTEAFTKTYARRAGIAGTSAQGTRTGALRRSRSIGLVKTRLLHLRLAAGLTFMRVAAGLAHIPRARTRPSAFAVLAAAAAS